MGLYRLKIEGDKLENGIMERVSNENVDYEKDFENWLENSPAVLLDNDDGSTVLWIGRQVSATVGDVGKYPDLIGIDAEGNLVIVELKKGKTPREVVAQILEYASWGASLKYEDLNQIAMQYFDKCDYHPNRNLEEAFREVFDPDNAISSDIKFNLNQKLFIVAEEISPIVRQVAFHLRSRYKLDLHCLEYQVMKTLEGDYLISTERVVGYDEGGSGMTVKGLNRGQRWNEAKGVKEVIRETVDTMTGGTTDVIFTPAQVISEVSRSYPNINRSTVRCQLIQDCVNHSSRKHYPGGQQDLYYLVDKGKYRLYDPSNDGKWNEKGEQIG